MYWQFQCQPCVYCAYSFTLCKRDEDDVEHGFDLTNQPIIVPGTYDIEGNKIQLLYLGNRKAFELISHCKT